MRSFRLVRGCALLLGLICAQVPAAQAQDVPLEVGEDRPVEVGATGLPIVEPHLAADLRDPAHLIGGAILVERMGDPRSADFAAEMSCAALSSYDAGRTWSRHDFLVDSCIDPWVAILPDGSALFVMLGEIPDSSGTRLLAFRSADGGRTWSDRPVSFGRGHDHPTLAVDATRSSFRGSVYVVSHQGTRHDVGRRDAVFVARSIDGGVTFGDPARLTPSNLSTFPTNPAILSDGTLVVPFSNFGRRMADGEFAFFARSPSWVVTSTDGGKTFSVPLFMALCAGGWSELAVDASDGPYRDRLYWVCHDRTYEHVYVYHSADRGETWSEPILVSRGAGRDPYVRNTAIAVNRYGVVGVSWYDARNDPRGYRGTFRCQELFFTASLDGGQSFLPEVKVSSAENCPDTPANGEAGRRWPDGGDYHGLAAAADGRFHVLWADSREGIYQLRTATIRVNAKASAGR